MATECMIKLEKFYFKLHVSFINNKLFLSV